MESRASARADSMFRLAVKDQGDSALLKGILHSATSHDSRANQKQRRAEQSFASMLCFFRGSHRSFIVKQEHDIAVFLHDSNLFAGASNFDATHLDADPSLAVSFAVMSRSPTVKLKHSGLPMPVLGFGISQGSLHSVNMLKSLERRLQVSRSCCCCSLCYSVWILPCRQRSSLSALPLMLVVSSRAVFADRNEPEVAEAIRQAVNSGAIVCREDIWFTSKINSREHGGNKTRKAINSSCNRIGDAQPLDLMLLHDACSGKERRLHAWKELLQAKAEGRVRSIGVSNFNVK